jgi:hypothetical protein
LKVENLQALEKDNYNIEIINLYIEKYQNILKNGKEDYKNSHLIISHSPEDNSECKSLLDLKIKKADLEMLRTASIACTSRENFFLVTNTSRKALKQTGDGHFSPVAAYHDSDYVLLLDAARFKYNSMWFKLKDVFDAFLNVDKTTNEQRGFIMSSRYF